MIKIKFPWDTEEKEKEEEKEEKTSIIKFDWDKPVEPTEPAGTTLTMLPSQHKIRSLALKEEYKRKPTLLETIGIKKPTKPEELKMGIEVAMGTWEEQKARNPELQKTEDLAIEVLSMRGINSSHEHAQIAYIYELLTTTETKAGVPMEETIKDIQSNLEKYGSINPPRDWKKAFKEEGILKTALIGPSEKYGEAESIRRGFVDIAIKRESLGADLISSMGWKGVILMLGSQAVAGAMSVSPSIWQKITTKEIKTKLSTRETFRLMWDVNYGKATKAQRKIFDSIIEQAEKTGLGVSRVIKEGFTYAEYKPRFAFGDKLYAGVPIDEMVKSIVEVGKLTKNITNALKVMNPVDTGLVFQQLSMASPAIASKLASEFVELIPQKITKIPKAGEEMTPEETEAFERLKAAKIIPEEEIEPTKAELKEIEKIEKGEIRPYAISKKTGRPMTKEELIEKVKERWIKTREEPEKIEPEPTPEEIRSVFMEEKHLDTTVKNREFFLSKFGKIFTETKAVEDTLIKQKFNEMNMLVEYEEDEIYRLAFGKDKMRAPVGSKTDWMEAIGKTKYMQIFRDNPNLSYPDVVATNLGMSEDELREQIAERIRTAPEEVTLESAKQALIDEGNAVFLQVGAQMDAYRILLDEIEGGEYSFDTPKNIKRLNAKISALKSDSKKLMAQYEEKITALQKEGIEKRFEELKKVTEAGKKVEVEIGVKKGVKEVFAARKLKGLPKEEYKKGNKIIGQIHKVVNLKGLTDKEFTALKQKYGYSPHLATKTKRMSIEQLEAVLKAVNRARPKIIGHMKVITPKTEKKIQSLKENLIGKLQMSEEVYEEVLKDVGVYKEPKYIDGKHFITETKGKDVIYRLIDEANILRSTLPYDKAVEEHPVIKKFIDREKAIIGRYRDRTMKDPREWNSMRVFAQKMEEITGKPVYRLYQDLIDVSLENKEKLGLFIRDFEPNKKLMKDLEALKRVTEYVGSKSNLKGKPEYPKDINAEEIKLAKKVEDMLIDYRARARTQKFLDNVDHPEDMPQYIEYKKEIDKAKDIYESKGYDDLVEYMKTQTWGIIRNGYDPDQVWSPKIRLYKPAPQTFGKHNIKVRVDIEYHEQERNIIERLFSYKKSMDNLVEMRPKVRAFITMMDQNLDKFSNPKRVQEVIEVFLRELKGYNKPEGLIERILNRAYAQAMQTIIMPSLAMFGRNCLQNLAFGYDKTIIIDPRNKKLSDGRIDFLGTYVSNLQAMKVDWFMVGEQPLPGLVWLTKMVNKVGIYPYSDEGNRHWGFWGKINQVDRAFKGVDANSTEKQISKAMKGAKFDDIERTERIMALEILANDGYEDMARYVSRCYVADTEFQYNRAERSPMEMGRGKWLSNLMLFPRSYWEMLLKVGNRFKTGNPRQKARAFKVLASIIIGSLIVGEGYKKVTGRRKHPYNPLVLLAYEPGGLAIGTVEAFSDVITNTILVLNGDERAATTLATAIPRLSDMMIPFYDYTLRAIEATVPMTYRGQHVNKRIDVLALRVLRKLTTDRMRELGWNVKGYKPSARGYYVERDFYQKLQYIIAGAGVDIGIKEKLRGKPVPSVKYEWEKTEAETKSIIKFDWD